jgi:hypothetical protein
MSLECHFKLCPMNYACPSKAFLGWGKLKTLNSTVYTVLYCTEYTLVIT